MRYTHALAAGLAAVLSLQATTLAQTSQDSRAVPVPRTQALHVLLTNINIGTDVHVELADGQAVTGRLVEKSDDAIAVVAERQRRIFPVQDVVSVHLATSGTTGNKAFGIGAGIGAGTMFGWFLILVASLR